MVSKKKRTVMIGFLGSRLDAGRGTKRWERWRPSVSLCQQEDLIVDCYVLIYYKTDESLVRQVVADIAQISPSTTVELIEFPAHNPWDFQEVYTLLHDIALSQAFNSEQEDYFVHITTGTHVAQICLYLLTEARYFPGVLIQTSPKAKGPEGAYQVIDLDLSQYDALAARFKQERRQGADLLKEGIETRNKNYNNLIKMIERVATTSRSPMLLTGPTGAGKSRLARRIYDLKKTRRQIDGPLVEVNCATIRGEGAMSTLFGHRRGSFTGAVEARKGLLVGANKGLLFLDEIGELGLDEQAMLLRAIEEKKFLPVGADAEVQSDFQLIAGTNRDLWKEVQKGRFRDDLLARINLWTHELPGLANRREDIQPNLDYELEEFARVSGSHFRMNKEARSRFLKFAESSEAVWLGNFRDLSAAVTRMATLSKGGRITITEVNEEIERLKHVWRNDSVMPSSTEGSLILGTILGSDRAEELDLFDRVQLETVINVCRRSRTMSEAGRTLFQASREAKKSTNDADRIRKYLARFQLDWKDVKSDPK